MRTSRTRVIITVRQKDVIAKNFIVSQHLVNRHRYCSRRTRKFLTPRHNLTAIIIIYYVRCKRILPAAVTAITKRMRNDIELLLTWRIHLNRWSFRILKISLEIHSHNITKCTRLWTWYYYTVIIIIIVHKSTVTYLWPWCGKWKGKR